MRAYCWLCGEHVGVSAVVGRWLPDVIVDGRVRPAWLMLYVALCFCTGSLFLWVLVADFGLWLIRAAAADPTRGWRCEQCGNPALDWRR